MAFIKLGNAQSRADSGKELVDETRNLVLSPVVIAMWKPMAEALGWGPKSVGWAEILRLAQDPKGWESLGHPEWGQFKFGHTHPEFSNSGLISLLAETYAAAGKVRGLSLEDVAKPETGNYLESIERSVVHYGSSTGFFGKTLFANGPQYHSAAVLYENMVTESYDQKYQLQFPIVAIYPREGTFWSDHPVGIVDKPWVSDEHKEAAGNYINWLLEGPQQERGLKFGFRPADVKIPLTAPLDLAHGVDPKEPRTILELPPTNVMDAVIKLWRQRKKHSDVLIVMDQSGSMAVDGRM